MKYRKKPVDAFRLWFDPYPEWFFDELMDQKVFLILNGTRCKYAVIRTPEGEMRAFKGDYIIRGVKGELYPCKADIFEKTYERVVEMTEREKMLEILQGLCIKEKIGEGLTMREKFEQIANQLIAKGVTVKLQQKPLQLDELKEHEGRFIWLEMKDRSNWRAFEPAKIDCVKRNITYFDCIGSEEEFYFENVFYNVEWRCWEEKPTEEERQDAEWE